MTDNTHEPGKLVREGGKLVCRALSGARTA